MFNGKIHYKWPCSIAMLNYQRVDPKPDWTAFSVFQRWNANLIFAEVSRILDPVINLIIMNRCIHPSYLLYWLVKSPSAPAFFLTKIGLGGTRCQTQRSLRCTQENLFKILRKRLHWGMALRVYSSERSCFQKVARWDMIGQSSFPQIHGFCIEGVSPTLDVWKSMMK